MTVPPFTAELGFGSTWQTADSSIAWTDITDFVLADQGVNVTRGRSSETDDYQAGRCSFTLLNSDRRFDPNHTGSPYNPNVKFGVPARVGRGVWCLDLPNQSGNRATTPDTASLDIIGDLDLRACVRLNDWTSSSFQPIVGKRTGTSPHAYSLNVGTPSGFLVLTHDGDGDGFIESTIPVTFADNTDHWIRATLDVDDGAGNHVVTFYTSDDPPDTPAAAVVWTVFGDPVTVAGIATVSSNDSVGFVGAPVTTWFTRGGRIYYAEIRNGINGAIVASPDFRTATTQASTITDAQGLVWTVADGATIRPRLVQEVFRGFVRGWPQEYDIGNKMSVVPVVAVDGFDFLATAPLPPSVYDHEVLADSPVAYWRCDDNGEASLADSSGNAKHGVWDNAEFGQPPLATDGGKAVKLNASTDARGRVDAPTVEAFPLSVEAWVKFPRDLAVPHSFLELSRDSTLNFGIWFGCHANTGGDNPFGWASFEFRIKGSPVLIRSRDIRKTVDDDEAHHIVVTCTTNTTWDTYVDGVDGDDIIVNSETPPSSWTNMHKVRVGNADANYRRGGAVSTATDSAVGGLIDNVAVYPSALSAARVAAHYNAGANGGWNGDTPATRIDRILDIVGWPASLRDLEIGDLALTAQGELGGNALSYLKTVETTEQGRLFIDRTGKVRFLNRYFWVTEPTSTTVQATVSDDTVDVRYRNLGFTYDVTHVVNHLTGSRAGGPTVEVSDATSVATHGERSDNLAGLQVATDNQVASVLNYRLGRFKDPQFRVGGLEVPLARNPTLQKTLLGVELGHRVKVERTPQGVGSQMVFEELVEGIGHRIGVGFWDVSLMTSPVDTDGDAWWVWGTSTWDTTTKWAY